MADNKQSKKETTRCINCAHATFMQWMNNPIIAHCRITDERQVAEAKRICKEYKKSNKVPEITRYKDYLDTPATPKQ